MSVRSAPVSIHYPDNLAVEFLSTSHFVWVDRRILHLDHQSIWSLYVRNVLFSSNAIAMNDLLPSKREPVFP